MGAEIVDGDQPPAGPQRTRIIAQHRGRRKYVGERAAVDDEIHTGLEPIRQRLAEIAGAVVARGADIEHVQPVDAEERKERGRAHAAAVGARGILHVAGCGLHVAGRGDDIVLAHQLQNFVAAERDGLLSDQQHVTRDRPIGVLADNGVDDIAAECHCLLPIAPNGRLGRQTDRLSATSPTQSAFRASTPDSATVLHRVQKRLVPDGGHKSRRNMTADKLTRLEALYVGIPNQVARLLMREHLFRPITGKLLSIGRQSVNLTPRQAISVVETELGTRLDVDPLSLEIDTSTRASHRPRLHQRPRVLLAFHRCRISLSGSERLRERGHCL